MVKLAKMFVDIVRMIYINKPEVDTERVVAKFVYICLYATLIG